MADTSCLTARVVLISGGLSKKEIRTDSPIDKVDTEVLELEPDTPSRIGLRVDLTIQMAYKEGVLIVPLGAVSQDEGIFIEVGEGLKEGEEVVY